MKRKIKKIGQKMTNKYKCLSDNKKNLLKTCIFFSLLITGLIYLAIGIYQTQLNSNNTHNVWISAFLIACWFILFPQSMDKKEKFIYHVCFSVITCILYCFIVWYWLYFLNTSILIWDIIIAFVLSILIAYTLYIFYKIYTLINKLLHIFTATLGTDKNSVLLSFIKGITSVLLTITAFFSAIYGLIEAVKLLT